MLTRPYWDRGLCLFAAMRTATIDWTAAHRTQKENGAFLLTSRSLQGITCQRGALDSSPTM